MKQPDDTIGGFRKRKTLPQRKSRKAGPKPASAKKAQVNITRKSTAAVKTRK